MRVLVLLFFILTLFNANAAVTFPNLTKEEICIARYHTTPHAIGKSTGGFKISCINEKDEINKYTVKDAIELGNHVFAELKLVKEMTKIQKFKLDTCLNLEQYPKELACYFSK